MEAFALTDVGIERKINQDYVYFTLKQTGHLPNLFIVADGMGGHKAGDVASRYTVDEFVSLIENAIEKDDIPKLIGFLNKQEQNGKYFSTAMGVKETNVNSNK